MARKKKERVLAMSRWRRNTKRKIRNEKYQPTKIHTYSKKQILSRSRPSTTPPRRCVGARSDTAQSGAGASEYFDVLSDVGLFILFYLCCVARRRSPRSSRKKHMNKNNSHTVHLRIHCSVQRILDS